MAVAVLVVVAAAAAAATAAPARVLVLVLRVGVAMLGVPVIVVRCGLGDGRAQRGEILLEEGELRRVQQLRLRLDKLDELLELCD